MTDSELQVSLTTGENWNSSIQVAGGNQLTGIKYKITLNGRTKVRVVFPVYDAADPQRISSDIALISKQDWDNINLVITDPEIGVTATRTNLPAGVYDFNTNENITEFVFHLELKNGITKPVDFSTAQSKLQYSTTESGRKKWNTLPNPVTIFISPKTTEPKVIKFTADPIVIGLNGNTKLSWEVIDAVSIKITGEFNKGKKEVEFSNKGECEISGLLTDSKYELNARNNINKLLTVKVSNGNETATVQKLFKDQKLMGLYVWQEKLYALVLHEDQTTPDKVSVPDNVILWESFDGINWQKTNVYSKTPAFITGKNSGADVPLDFAGSPGIVFKDKLYLIGGSRCDPNFRSNDVYFFDFERQEDGWQKDSPAGFTPRMGHACIVYKNEIWITGGYDDQGANNDVWKFDGAVWTCISHKENGDATSFALPGNRFMHSAIVYEGQIQIYGGFGNNPGVPDQNFKSSYYLKGDEWKPIEIPGNPGTDYTDYYFTCTVAVLKDNRFILSKKNKAMIEKIYVDSVTKISDLNVQSVNYGETGIFNIQAVPFKNVFWICVLNKALDTFQSLDLRYFVYVENN